MLKDVFLLLLMGHFLGDFYFQSHAIAKTKDKDKGALFTHCSIYALTMFLVAIPLFSWSMLVTVFLLAIAHLVIDSVKHRMSRRRLTTYQKEARLFVIDQMLHLGCIVLAVIGLSFIQEPFEYLPILTRFFSQLAIQPTELLAWVVMLLFIMQPASITIKKVLYVYRPIPDTSEDGEGVPNAGSLIGIFERLFIFLMLSVSQYTAIGFILTAKSIARYNKISESPQFAEYYLLGTLLSSLLVVIGYLLIF